MPTNTIGRPSFILGQMQVSYLPPSSSTVCSADAAGSGGSVERRRRRYCCDMPSLALLGKILPE